MSEYYRQTSNAVYVTDPMSGEIVTSHRIPAYIESSPDYGSGIQFLRDNAEILDITLHLIQHDTALNLGSGFEQKVSESDVIALEEHGCPTERVHEYKKLAYGTLEDFLSTFEPYERQSLWYYDALNPQRYVGKLLRSLEKSEKLICVADIIGEEEKHARSLARLDRQSYKYGDPVQAATVSAHREWIMLANLGVQLEQAGIDLSLQRKVLWPVGRTHFLLMDKLMTLGNMPRYEVASGDAGTDAEADFTKLYRPLGNIGTMPLIKRAP
jgi:hypothetical protein